MHILYHYNPLLVKLYQWHSQGFLFLITEKLFFCENRKASMATARDRHYDTTGGACIVVAGLAPAMQKKTLLANGISGRKIARHAVFPLFCALSLPIWNEK
jgi:hypothetical protein